MTKNVGGIIAEANAEHIYSYLKLFILLFADDTVLFSHNQYDLQSMLNSFENYCDEWKLTVNISKTRNSYRIKIPWHLLIKQRFLSKL